jgi:hypothetical protein
VVSSEDTRPEGFPELGSIPEEMEEALARISRATEELPPLEELAALQEAMTGLAEMGALLEGMRLGCERAGEDREKPREGSDHADVEGA